MFANEESLMFVLIHDGLHHDSVETFLIFCFITKVYLIGVMMFPQVLLGMDLPPESKMNSESESRPGCCESGSDSKLS